ncbi:MAG: hypothetical protein HRT80_02700 [Henriciella sp.]|nr:hypothetical protein [Henriciella sp.]
MSVNANTDLSGKRVLLLGDSRMAFPIAKAYSKQGVSVFSGVSVYSNYLEWSRYLNGTFSHPSTDSGTDAALSHILRWLKTNGPTDAIQPVSESASRLVSRHRVTFEALAPLIMPQSETVETCWNKAEMFRLCERLGVPLAPYRIVASKRDVFDAAAEIGFPLIVKPSCVDAEIFGRKALTIRSTPDLNCLFPTWPQDHPELIVQRYVSGRRHSVIFSAESGRVLKAVEVAAHRTHERDGTGYTTLGVTVAPTPAVKMATEALVQALNYRSTGCTQFMVDPETGEVTFMELNPRTSLARIAEVAGVPHSLLGLQTCLNVPHPDLGDPWETRFGTRYVWTKGDLMRLKRSIGSGQGSKGEHISDLVKIGVDAMTSTHAIFDLTDPAPAFGVYLNFFLKRVRRSERYELLPEPAV